MIFRTHPGSLRKWCKLAEDTFNWHFASAVSKGGPHSAQRARVCLQKKGTGRLCLGGHSQLASVLLASVLWLQRSLETPSRGLFGALYCICDSPRDLLTMWILIQLVSGGT